MNSNLKRIIKQSLLYKSFLKFKWTVYPVILRQAQIDVFCPGEKGIKEQLANNSPKIIISLTSFPGRIEIVYKTIITLLNQTEKPDAIILWLAKEQFPQGEQELPNNLTKLIDYGLTIKWCAHDIKSYKKLIPALREYPNDIIITADDDLYYPSYWVESLIKSYNKHPKEIHCHMITPLCNKKGKIDKTKIKKSYRDTSGFGYKLLGGSGTLYPPNALYKDVCNESIFMDLCPTSDDIWFWANAVRNGTKIRWISENMNKLYYIEWSQERTSCLWQVNDEGENNFKKHLNKVVEYYNLSSLIK